MLGNLSGDNICKSSSNYAGTDIVKGYHDFKYGRTLAQKTPIHAIMEAPFPSFNLRFPMDIPIS
jgi:hypothetical protein